MLLVWLNQNKTFLSFSPPVFLPEVLCEQGVLAASWRSSVPLHRGRRAHLWVWRSGRYSETQHMSSPGCHSLSSSKLVKWIKYRKCLNQQRNRLIHPRRFGNESGNNEWSIILCVSKMTLVCKRIFYLSCPILCSVSTHQISHYVHHPHI